MVALGFNELKDYDNKSPGHVCLNCVLFKALVNVIDLTGGSENYWITQVQLIGPWEICL